MYHLQIRFATLEKKPREQASHVDPYLPYLTQRWESGCHNIASLFRELVEQGYKGSYESVRNTIIRLLPTGCKHGASSLSKPSALVTSWQAAFLFLRRPEELSVEEQETLVNLRELHPEVELTADLVQQFTHMLRTRTGEKPNDWLTRVLTARSPNCKALLLGLKGIKRLSLQA